MRVNIYGEELTNKIDIVKKAVDQRLFIAVRLYFKSHQDLHHSDSDNDESAVTFWTPWTKQHGNDIERLAMILENASRLLRTQINDANRK